MTKKALLLVFFFCIALPARPDVKQAGVITGRGSPVRSAVFSPDSNYLAASWLGSKIRIWRMPGLAPVMEMAHGAEIESLAYSPDGKLLASAGGDGTIKIWSVRDGGLLKTFEISPGLVFSVAFTPASDFIAAGSLKKIYIWKTRDFKQAMVIDTGMQWAKCAAFSPDEKYFLAAGNGIVSLWDMRYGSILSALSGAGGLAIKNKRDFAFGAQVYSADFSRDSQYFAATGGDGSVKTWRVEDGSLMWAEQAHSGIAWAVAFSDQYLVSAGDDRMINFYGIKNGRPLFSASGKSGVVALAFSRNGKYLASAGRDGSVTVWRVSSGGAPVAPEVLKAWLFPSAGGIAIVLLAALVRKLTKKKRVKDWTP